MRRAPAFVLALVLAAAAPMPALAQTASDTLKEVTTKGVVLSAGGFEIDVAYTPDGKFTAAEGAVFGTWRIDGEKLCTTSNFAPDEECVAYPTGKKSGDTFEVVGGQGPANVTIK